LPGKIESFPWKNRNFSEVCLEKSKCFIRIHDPPQISNQIDAVGDGSRTFPPSITTLPFLWTFLQDNSQGHFPQPPTLISNQVHTKIIKPLYWGQYGRRKCRL